MVAAYASSLLQGFILFSSFFELWPRFLKKNVTAAGKTERAVVVGAVVVSAVVVAAVVVVVVLL